jgi:hypothetical protein
MMVWKGLTWFGKDLHVLEREVGLEQTWFEKDRQVWKGLTWFGKERQVWKGLIWLVKDRQVWIVST